MTLKHENSIPTISGWAVTALAVAGLMMSGCGNGLLNNGGTSVTNSSKTMTATIVTDAPGDQVLALELTVDSIVLTDASGAGTTVLSTPVTIEASHLDGVQEPLLPPLNIPQDTYTSATITVGAPVVVYADPTTKTVTKVAATLADASTTVTFTTPIKVTATSSPICFDLLVGPSVAISGTTVTVTPTWNVFQVPLSSAPTNPGNGKVSGVVGEVASVSGTTLNLTLPNGNTLAITTNSSTVLQGFSMFSALTAGELVDVDVAQQQNGTLLALRIHLIPAAAATAYIGPVTAVTGSPATSFTQLARQPLGASASPTATTTSYTVTINSSTTFGLAAQAGTLPALPFTPTFGAATMFAGQNVLTAAASVSGTSVTAASVTLMPQTVDGTVTAITTLGGLTVYTVTLNSGSALGTLTGQSTVVVYTGTATASTNATTPAVGDSERFNGLLFSDSGTLKMVGLLSCDPSGPPPPQHH